MKDSFLVFRNVMGKRKTKVSMLFFAMMLCVASSAFAATDIVDTTAVTSTFASITIVVLAVIGAVAASAVSVMGVILAWKYGRKLFGMLAK